MASIASTSPRSTASTSSLERNRISRPDPLTTPSSRRSRTRPLDPARLEPSAKLLESRRLDLPDTLPCDAHPASDRVEGHRRVVLAEPEALEQDLPLLERQIVQQPPEVRLLPEQ